MQWCIITDVYVDCLETFTRNPSTVYFNTGFPIIDSIICNAVTALLGNKSEEEQRKRRGAGEVQEEEEEGKKRQRIRGREEEFLINGLLRIA